MKTIVMDLDNTISFTKSGDYSAAEVDIEVVAKMREYKEMGFKIVIHSARNMRTYDGNLGLINANTLPVVMRWLDENDIPYDEILWVNHGADLMVFMLMTKQLGQMNSKSYLMRRLKS